MKNPYDDDNIIDITEIVNNKSTSQKNHHPGFDLKREKITLIKVKTDFDKKLSFLYLIVHFNLIFNLVLLILVFYAIIFK